jgi:hypothetical protein
MHFVKPKEHGIYCEGGLFVEFMKRLKQKGI